MKAPDRRETERLILRRPRRVLEEAGFVREGVLHRYLEFPNLGPGWPADPFCYARILRGPEPGTG